MILTGGRLRRLARLSGHANQVRRLLALAVIYDGGARHEAARVGGVGLQTVRDWVLRFNAQGPDGLLDGKAPGPRPVLGPEQKRALAAVIEQGPIPASHGVVRWRIVDLIQWLFNEYGVSISKQTLIPRLDEEDSSSSAYRPARGRACGVPPWRTGHYQRDAV